MGGPWANAVYTNNFYVENTDYTYQGCFRDDGNRDFGFGPRNYGYDWVTCREACYDFKYFALQHNGWCSCDNSYGNPEHQYPQIDDSECHDYAGWGMGGGWANAVFQNNLYIERDLYTPADQLWYTYESE